MSHWFCIYNLWLLCCEILVVSMICVLYSKSSVVEKEVCFSSYGNNNVYELNVMFSDS